MTSPKDTAGQEIAEAGQELADVDGGVMTPVSDVEARTAFAGDAAGPVSVGQYWQQYRNKLRAGDVGSLPALLGLLVLSSSSRLLRPAPS